MSFTKDEIICLNSVLDKKYIFGFNESAPSEPDGQYLSATLSGLQKKHLLDEAQKPTPAFAVITKVLEEYKCANVYVSVNTAHVAVGREHLIILGKQEKNYELKLMERPLFFTSLFHRMGIDEENAEEPARVLAKVKMERKTFLASKKELYPANFFWLQRYEKRRITRSDLLYQQGTSKYRYAVLKETLYQLNAAAQRDMLRSYFTEERSGKKT